MRKTLIAMLGLAALVVWALPAFAGQAGGPPKVQEYQPLDGRAGAVGALAKSGNYTATLSGTNIKRSSVETTSWYLYPGACQDRQNGVPPGLGTWAAKTGIVADSINSYSAGTVEAAGYTKVDLSLVEILWHKVTTAVPAAQRPTIIAGLASLWCGKYDAGWVDKVGYPNLTFQLLYIDTGPHAANYVLQMVMDQTTEQNYDYVYLIGGDTNAVDPVGNDRSQLDALVASDTHGVGSDLLVTWTGTITANTTVNTTAAAAEVTGAGSGDPPLAHTVGSITIAGRHRALYFLMTADCLFSNEDGLWPFGNGVVYDNIRTSDQGAGVFWFDEGTPPVGTDPVLPPGAGQPISGTFGTPGYVAGRVTSGQGDLWQIVTGVSYGTDDTCQPQKTGASSTDKFFFGADPGDLKTKPGQFNSIVTCTFPLPGTGVASILAFWGEYLDLPRGSGMVQYSEFRFYKGGSWSNWANTAPGGGVRTSVIQQWVVDGDELAAAVQADSIQIRYNMQCIPPFGTNGVCEKTKYGILYDDFFLQVLTGVPAPIFGIFVGSVAQTTFVDGTMTGTLCSVTPCWPGIRGSQANGGPGNSNLDIQDNFNSPLGDSITISLVTGLRKNGMGINWKQGFDRTVGEGLVLAHTNGAFRADKDQPRVIYRLFDPFTHTWSPFDSSALDANNIGISGPDTVIIDSEYRMNWPPRDKAGTNLPPANATTGWPGGLGNPPVSAYNSLKFLPRGTRLQYYIKAVDISPPTTPLSGVSYQFSTDAFGREVEDLPNTPGDPPSVNSTGPIAPDIIEFDVLPRAYAAGNAGTLLAGKTNTPILNLDGNYSVWSFQQDPVTQALRAMGVRADRYRLLQGLGEGANIGGHELTSEGQRPDRLSNYFPNMTEYSIRDSMSVWYRIMIQSSHTRSATLEDESDARLIQEWWNSSTGNPNSGDRCVFVSGDDYFNSLVNTPAGDTHVTRRHDYGSIVLGVSAVANGGAYNGTGATLLNGGFDGRYPTLEDRFANPGSGPNLLAGYTFPLDLGCPGPNKADPLTKAGSADAQYSAFYPAFFGVTDAAAVAVMTENDPVTDFDRGKSLGYGFSIQYVRKAGVPISAANYVHSGVEERMQILYKFLTSCRGARSGAPGDTARCWPCPSNSANKTANWNGDVAFQTGVYGPLYAIQDNQVATGVVDDPASAAPRVNKLNGNFPNPFNPQTAIRFSSAGAGKVTIRIFNVGGQLVRTLSTKADAGANEVRWNGRRDDGTPLASGIYFYKIRFADGTESGSRMALVK